MKSGNARSVVASAILGAGLLLGCSKPAPEPEVRYVPIPVPANQQPTLPNLRDEADARAEIVCDANGGTYFSGQCNYFGSDDPGDLPCDSAFEQQSFSCKDP